MSAAPQIPLPAVIARPRPPEIIATHAIEIDEGQVIIGSDCHYRPDEPASTAHRAFVQLTSRLAEAGTLRAVILNGDAADFPKISKHARIMWEPQPTVAEELAVVRQRMTEIAAIAGLDTELVLTIGNHDARLSSKLSVAVPEFEGVPGFDFRSHIGADWAMAWQVEINGSGPDSVLVKHRHRSGPGAARATMCSRLGALLSQGIHTSPASPD
jgi:hypothetical protein